MFISYILIPNEQHSSQYGDAYKRLTNHYAKVTLLQWWGLLLDTI